LAADGESRVKFLRNLLEVVRSVLGIGKTIYSSLGITEVVYSILGITEIVYSIWGITEAVYSILRITEMGCAILEIGEVVYSVLGMAEKGERAMLVWGIDWAENEVRSLGNNPEIDEGIERDRSG
jgi:hypothetical protein